MFTTEIDLWLNESKLQYSAKRGCAQKRRNNTPLLSDHVLETRISTEKIHQLTFLFSQSRDEITYLQKIMFIFQHLRMEIKFFSVYCTFYIYFKVMNHIGHLIIFLFLFYNNSRTHVHSKKDID